MGVRIRKSWTSEISQLLDLLSELQPELELYEQDVALEEENKHLRYSLLRLQSHVIGQDKIIAELKDVTNKVTSEQKEE